MLGTLGYLHGLLFRLVLWVLMLPVRALWSTVRAMLALLGEEAQRYVGLVVSGLLLLGAGKATLSFAPPSIKKTLVLVVLAMVGIWAFAVRRAFRYTRYTNLQRVRQRQWFRQVAGMEQRLGERFRAGAANAAWGTPAQGAFRSNRERAHREIEQEQRSRRQADEDERRRDELADLEPSPY